MSTETQHYSIEELAERAGLNRRTVRYYIQLGLLERPIGETRAAYYTQAHLEQLLRITGLAAEGLSLDAIGRVLRTPAAKTADASHVAPAAAPAVGSVAVRTHLTIAPGVELVVDPARAGLAPEQRLQLFRAVLREYAAAHDAAHGGESHRKD